MVVNTNKLLTTLILLCLAGSAVFGAKMMKRVSAKAPLDRSQLHTIGNPKAPIQVTEHMDYQCHTCRDAYLKMEEYLKAYPTKIYLQVRFHFFDSRPAGRRAAIFAECAGQQGKFWAFHRLLFDKQESWAPSPDFVDDTLTGYAKELGVDAPKLQACVDDLATLKTVAAERDDGTLAGVQYTPTFFINGKMVVGPENLTKEMDSLLLAESSSVK